VGVQRDSSFSEGFQQDLSDSHDDLVTKVFEDKNLSTVFSVSENNPLQQQMGQYWEADLWRKPISDKYEQCIDRDKSYKSPGEHTNGYLLINANGGLNQMRAGVSEDPFLSHYISNLFS
jgi:hypothetical protein